MLNGSISFYFSKTVTALSLSRSRFSLPLVLSRPRALSDHRNIASLPEHVAFSSWRPGASSSFRTFPSHTWYRATTWSSRLWTPYLATNQRAMYHLSMRVKVLWLSPACPRPLKTSLMLAIRRQNYCVMKLMNIDSYDTTKRSATQYTL